MIFIFFLIVNFRKPTHYIYIHDTTYLLDSLGLVQQPRGSLQSIRRGSFDVKSLGSDSKICFISKLNFFFFTNDNTRE